TPSTAVDWFRVAGFSVRALRTRAPWSASIPMRATPGEAEHVQWVERSWVCPQPCRRSAGSVAVNSGCDERRHRSLHRGSIGGAGNVVRGRGVLELEWRG